MDETNNFDIDELVKQMEARDKKKSETEKVSDKNEDKRKKKNDKQKKDEEENLDLTDNKDGKKRRIKKQKIFIILSIIFLLTCIFVYGGRFLYFYLDNKKVEKEQKNYIATTIKNDNAESKNFKQVGSDYYFYGDVKNNYMIYSNLLFRIIKVNEDNTVTAISEDPVSLLAFGEKDYSDSNIIKWLNDENGFGSKLNNAGNYLVDNGVCADKVNKVNKISCKDVVTNQFNLLSVNDYMTTGNTKSFINNGYYNYLANKNKDGEVWYIGTDGKLSTSEGKDIYGFKPVVSFVSTLEFTGGKGTSDEPYTLKEDNSYFGAYVKLGDDLWRVYDAGESVLKLSLTDTIKTNNEKFVHTYSAGTSKYNLNYRSSLAYYLNYNYISTLGYKDMIVDNDYYNGYYASSDYDYTKSLGSPVKTKVGIPSMGEVIFPTDAAEFFTATGTAEGSAYVYVVKNGYLTSYRGVKLSSEVVPCISINKEKLTAGNGSKKEPYRVE